MVGTVAVWALESRYDISGAVEFELFIGYGGAGNVAAQLLQFFYADSWRRAPRHRG